MTMPKVVAMYEDGRIWSCEVDAVGDGDAGEICAASVTVAIIADALAFKPAVMPWKDGLWRSPTGVVDEWTNSSAGFVDARGECHDMRGSSAYSQRGTVEESYAQECYVLLTPRQLEGAVSITVDGVLTYSRENGKLVPAVGGEDGADGMDYDFATLNRPAAGETLAGMARLSPSADYGQKVM